MSINHSALPKALNTYLDLSSEGLKEKTVSAWARLWRLIGSYLGICDSSIVFCAKKTLESINLVYNEKNLREKIINNEKGKDYITKIFQQVQSFQNQHELTPEFKRQMELSSLGWQGVIDEKEIQWPINPVFKPLINYLAQQRLKNPINQMLDTTFRPCALAVLEKNPDPKVLEIASQQKDFKDIYIDLCVYKDFAPNLKD